MSGGREVYRDQEVVRRMTRLVAEGATMLADTCPIDGLPLFKLKSGDIICPVHGKVWIVSSEAEAEEVEIDFIIRKVELHAAKRVYQSLNSDDASELIPWLNVIETVERIRSIREARSRDAVERQLEKTKREEGEK
ncbi:MAG: Sjogren's syndrome/scleroderma autoantigen 1 family protein [Desulfurococcales archaeon]|jgi:UPF0148 protein|nr:Sjogren's syndrome/scleroderma autoantigen 1 family protein [Desulfurococcales archaeon]